MKDELENEVNKKIELMQGGVLRQDLSKEHLHDHQHNGEYDENQYEQEEESPIDAVRGEQSAFDQLKEDTVRTEKLGDN